MKILLFIGTIVFGLFYKEKKYFWLWCALLFVFIHNTSVSFADYDNYERYFMRVTSGEMGILYMGMPVGWYYLCLLFAQIGLSYRGMTTVLIILSFFLVHRFVKTIDCKEGAFWSLFILFPGLVQVVQLRFFLGSAIVFWTLGSLVRKEKWGLIRFLLGVFIAYFIHASCAIFLVFAFIILFDRFDTRKAIFMSVCGTALLYLASAYIPQVVALYIPSVKYERYFESSISETTTTWAIRIALVWIICVAVGLFCYRRLKKVGKGTNSQDLVDFNSIIAPNMMTCISLLCLTLPFLAFDMNFHRFLEVGYMVLFVLIARLWRFGRFDRKTKYTYLLLFMVIMVRLTYIYTPFSTIIQPFFTLSGFHSLLM